jgi:feruloyl-CoA synthase
MLANRIPRVAEPHVRAVHRANGTILLDNDLTAPPVRETIPGRLAKWATGTPDAVYLSEDERHVTFAQAEARRHHIAARLLSTPWASEVPILILAANGIDHALAMLAATSIGITVAVVSPAYVDPVAAPFGKLARVLDQVKPKLVLADDTEAVRTALVAVGASDVEVGSLQDLHWLDSYEASTPQALRNAEASVETGTIAKLLFTSGSTGHPKAVMITQGMMVSNMQALALVWPFLEERRPELLDWLPWNHVFGGNCCFNIALWFGGHFRVDRGKPSPGMIKKSVAALRSAPPTVYFNVPLGYELLLPFLEQDSELAARFLGNVDFLFSAGAPMPASIRSRLEQVCRDTIGRVPMIVGGWGSTETAPFSTVLSFDTAHAGNLGIPIPGTTIKLVPDADRYELRVRGPNVTPGYWHDPAATAQAFDEEGFYRIGDAGKLADPLDPSAGILFDGRVSENFKLSSGTFVNVGALRVAAISAGGKMISDAVVAGENRAELGLLLFVNHEACRDLLGPETCAALTHDAIVDHPEVIAHIADRLRAHNANESGSSKRFRRFLILQEPPSAAHDEITDKGYINQRRVLTRRAALVDLLFSEGIAL